MLGFDQDLLIRRLCGDRAFWDAAVEKVEVCPPEVVERPAAFFEDDPADITGLAPGVGLETRIAYMKGGPVDLGPTSAFRFKDLRISQGSIYSGTGHVAIRKQERRAFGKKTPEIVSGTVALSCNRAATSVFYHWAVEQLNRELLAEDFGVSSVSIASRKPFWHEQDIREKTGLSARLVDDAVLENAWVFIDRPRNSSFAERFDRIRAKTVETPSDGTASKLIYLRRGQRDAEKREIHKEAEFEAFLEGLGFETLDASSASVAEMAAVLANSKLTVTIEGSQAANHFLFAPRGAGLLTLMPSDRFNHILKETADILDMAFGFVLGGVTASGEYSYPKDVLERVLQRMLEQRRDA